MRVVPNLQAQQANAFGHSGVAQRHIQGRQSQAQPLGEFQVTGIIAVKRWRTASRMVADQA
jgi:hypothetical protein